MSLFVLTVISAVLGSTSYKTQALVSDGVAVFEPDNYSAEPHTPSPIFVGELSACGTVPADWKLFPKFSRLPGDVSVYFDTGDADLYGAGEVLGNLRRNDDHQFFWNTENPTAFLFKGKKIYQSHPWVLGVRRDGSAFGLIADTTWESELDTRHGVIFSSKGPAFRVVVIDGEDPAAVMRSLAELTGKMALPPLWALGYQQCRYSYYPQEQAAEIADNLRRSKIPCDVIWLDIHYMDKFKIFTFNPEGFSRPQVLNDYLHQNNFKSVYMIDPGVKAEEGYFVDDQGRAGDYFIRDRKGELYHGPVWPGECHFPDFTNPETCNWWAGLYRDFLSCGIDGVWNDMNEPSVMNAFGGTIPKDARHKGGGEYAPDSHARYHNIYGYLMAKATLAGVQAANPDKRPFVLSRSNFLGGHRYAAMWTGDNYSDYLAMKESVPMCLNISLSGQPFTGPDIGGFLRDCTPDLLRHWTASGIYFPFARNHSMFGTVQQEPWAFDALTLNICRTAIERRYRLLPYYYTLFDEASRTGLPVMRPVFWADFRDPDLRAEQQAFLVGGDLLVIPRWFESPSLPKGGWKLFSFENGPDDGYQSYLAIRPGAIIPLSDVVQSTVDYNPGDVTVLVNPDSTGRAHGSLYVDEGEGFAYRDGDFGRYDFDAVASGQGVSVTMTRVEGSRPFSGRLRVAVIAGGQLAYSPWVEAGDVCGGAAGVGGGGAVGCASAEADGVGGGAVGCASAEADGVGGAGVGVSSWTVVYRASIDVVPSAVSVCDAPLRYVYLQNNSISKQTSKMELITDALFGKK